MFMCCTIHITLNKFLHAPFYEIYSLIDETINFASVGVQLQINCITANDLITTSWYSWWHRQIYAASRKSPVIYFRADGLAEMIQSSSFPQMRRGLVLAHSLLTIRRRRSTSFHFRSHCLTLYTIRIRVIVYTPTQ